MIVKDYQSLLSQLIELTSKQAGSTQDVNIIAQCVALAEARIRTKLCSSGMRQIAKISTTTSSRSMQLPPGVVVVDSLLICLGSATVPLTQHMPGQISYVDTETLPGKFAVSGDAIQFNCRVSPNVVFELRYSGLIPLSDANPVNPVLQKYLNLYIYGALYEFWAFAANMEEMNVRKAQFDAALAEAQAVENAAWTGCGHPGGQGFSIEGIFLAGGRPVA